ncbi:hypothetical protein Lal_00048049 [Lupinus albus]|nr:hypothetical protein Lal_00048049 [Lupinus albus]
MGVDIIEAGFPIASIGDFEAVSEIARRTKRATIAGLARAIPPTSPGPGEAVRHAQRGASTPSSRPRRSTSRIRCARRRTRPWPGPRPRGGRGMVGHGRHPHAHRLPVPLRRGGDQGRRHDDQPARHGGLRHARRVQEMFRAVRGGCRTPTRRSSRSIVTTTSASPSPTRWRDRGRRPAGECTINGIGERAGNAALEEIVMAIRTRADVMPYETGIESQMLTRASKLVSHATNFPVQFNKAIVGRNAFAHESGIHQDGMLRTPRPTRS